MRLRSLALSLAILLGLAGTPASGRSSGSHTSSSSTRSHHSSTRSSEKPVHVKEYKRKDGTVVHAHTRNYPGEGSHSRSSSGVSNRSIDSSGSHLATASQPHGRSVRSTAAKDSFKHQHPCPATGKPSGPCRGYVIDHVKPLACGGADDPSNMQWQTVAEGRAKDKWERNGCK